MQDQHIQIIKNIADHLSVGIMIGTIIQYLPSAAAALTVIWTLFRISEEPKVKRFMRWIKKRDGG